ncbi:MAG: FAD-dependent oxidoreductase [Candidatus Micrarchaeota archaeon]|nr:FAD-dependent oxidoreductase [Candidatus Micrarchaeota archaeon]
MYDVIIIGGGPAGLTAAIYAARRKLGVLVIAKQEGGQMARAGTVENYPGFEKIGGAELASRMEGQARKHGAEIICGEALGAGGSAGNFAVSTADKKYESKAVIIATGMAYGKLGVGGEDKFTGKGVSFCATCDGPLFAGKDVAVVGGGNAAVETAIFMEKVAREVFLIHGSSRLSGEEALQKKLKKTRLMPDSAVTSISGGKFVESIEVESLKTGEKKTIPVQGVFVHVGMMPETRLARRMGVEVGENGFIRVNEKQETNVGGVFAAGDVTGWMRQMVCAASQGAVAGSSAYSFIEKNRG